MTIGDTNFSSASSGAGSDTGAGGASRKSQGDREASGIGGRDLSRLIEALPPHAPGAEMSLLGAMLWDHTVIPEVIGIMETL